MFSFTKSLFAAAALLAVLPSSFAQTAAEQAQLRIRNCQATIETPDFNNEYNFAVNDQTAWSQRYTYSYEGKYLSEVQTCMCH